MNTPLRRLTTLVMSLFLILMLGATSVQFFQADSLNKDPRNVRTLYREFGNFRGPILVAGSPIAVSTPVDDSFGYLRTYPQSQLYAPLTGYYSVVYGRSGIERAMNTPLNGTDDSQFFNRVHDLITGQTPQGASVELTINPAAQQAAWDALGDQKGAVVAIDVKTGAILAMVSKPTFDPAALASHSTPEVVKTWNKLIKDPARPLENRTISGYTYPPGSVFKLITAAAALQAGTSPEAKLTGEEHFILPGSTATVGNYGGGACSRSGEITLADALRISCNTAFAQLGTKVGAKALKSQAEAFGFGSSLSVPMPVSPSVFPDKIDAAKTALSAIGQYDVRVTPLQVAMISQAIANGGTLMKPYLVNRVISSNLEPIDVTSPQTLGTPITAQTASTLNQMMVKVVEDGTGTGAQLNGISVAGKTGTAETTANAAPHAWFTGFAPANDPKVAVAVIVEHGGDAGSEATGGKVAAPIAAAVLKAVIGG